MPEFRNEAMTDFSRPESQAAQRDALRKVEAAQGRSYPLVIGGQRIAGGPTFDSINPSQPSQVIGKFTSATVEQARDAVTAAAKAFETWRWMKTSERAAV